MNINTYARRLEREIHAERTLDLAFVFISRDFIDQGASANFLIFH